MPREQPGPRSQVLRAEMTARAPPPCPGLYTHIVKVCLELVCAEHWEAMTQSIGLTQDLVVKGDLS